MARNRDPFSHALQTLRGLAVDGVFSPDRPIVILDAAHRLHLSTTPVREALAWLGGEGMIERSPNGGYTGLRQDATSVSGRYRLRLVLITAALHEPRQTLNGWIPPVETSFQDILAALVRLGGDDVLWRAYDRVARQLMWLANAEAAVIPEFDRQVETLRDLISGEHRELIEALESIHRTLAAHSAAILLAARRPELVSDASRDS